MTEYEDLIADTSKWIVLHENNKYQREAARRMKAVIRALEKVTAERDAARREDAHHSSLLGNITEMYKSVLIERDEALKEADLSAEERGRLIEEQAEAERDQLAAVVEQVRQWRHDWFNEPIEGVKRKPHHRRLDDILDAAPSVALDRVKAEALREAADYLDSFEGPGGRQSAHDRAGRDIIRLISDRADCIEKGGSNDQ